MKASPGQAATARVRSKGMVRGAKSCGGAVALLDELGDGVA